VTGTGGLTGKALIADPDGGFRLADVETAPVGKDDIGIRALWSGVSIGTEFAVLTGKLDWGSFPVVTGYMATGLVVSVGSDVSGYSVGDTVYYRRNAALKVRGTGEWLNCRSGTHASVSVLNPSGNHGAELLPAGVAPDTGSLFVMPAVGLYGVDLAQVGVGATVVVIGLGMIGLGVVSAAVRRGAVVTGIDPRGECRAIATKFGATATFGTEDDGTSDRIPDVLELTGGDGADFVFESTGRHECIDAGIRMCKRFGCFVWQGNYGNGPASFEFLEAHQRQLRMVFPCDDGYRAYRRASMQAVASGAMPWGEVITQRISCNDMPDLYGDIFHHRGPSVIGAVVNWEGAD
jgi:2-desacetyl-2-hydroxyethyl bacteriochlorophyllide A dehydrogenase